MKYRIDIFYRSILHTIFILSIAMLTGVSISKVTMAGDISSETPLATFDFAIAETLSAIGHPPRFLAGLRGYETYSRQSGIIPFTENLGSRFLPNYELLANHPPQYILISPPAHVNIKPRLRRISDVKEYLLYNFSGNNDDHDHWEAVEKLTRQLGDLVHAPARADQYIEKTNSYFDDLRSQLDGSSDFPILIVRLIDERHARIYGEGSVEGMVVNRLGLQNAWQGDLGQWGMTTVSATPLFDIDAKVIFLESPYDPPGGQKRLLSNGQWRHLPAVKESNYTIVPINYWSWGGLPSAQRFANNLVSHLTESNFSDATTAE
ncbi:ABC transporter substrate-binding protein [Halomonas salipaludis]|uniref:Fe/B12 periplasmic-binding domain-containing protein n=1 Tax=Halomonas salipaludis TaxID=2032625 RepID=A0A2A2EQA6_9GAMM|nr:ABC transporter substrate-binding protein [Halomonas salipaludis]PAU75286.1 hypothetical protein CK498_19280 [Halomonas salipaludis]